MPTSSSKIFINFFHSGIATTKPLSEQTTTQWNRTTSQWNTTTAQWKTTTAQWKTTTAQWKTTTAQWKTTTAQWKTTTAQRTPACLGEVNCTGKLYRLLQVTALH